jgi:hypothetical protein
VCKCKITEPHKEEAKARYGLQRHIIIIIIRRRRRRRRRRRSKVWKFVTIKGEMTHVY